MKNEEEHYVPKGMVKDGKVRRGVTPSQTSGRPCRACSSEGFTADDEKELAAVDKRMNKMASEVAEL